MQPLGHRVGVRRAACDAGEHLAERRIERGRALAGLIDQPDALRLAPVEPVRGEREPPRARDADALRDERRDLRRRNAERGLGDREFRIRRRQHDVAAAHQPEPAAIGRALDHHHDRLRQRLETRHDRAEAAIMQGDSVPLAGLRQRCREKLLEAVDVSAGAERAVRAAHHGGPDIPIAPPNSRPRRSGRAPSPCSARSSSPGGRA